MISKWGAFSPFLCLVILCLVLPSHLNVILFSNLFIYSLIEGLSIISTCFSRYTKYNREFEMQNYFFCFCMNFLYFSCVLFDKAVDLSLLLKFNSSAKLSNSLYGSYPLIFWESKNIASNLYNAFVQFIILLYTLLLISFARYKEHMI